MASTSAALPRKCSNSLASSRPACARSRNGAFMPQSRLRPRKLREPPKGGDLLRAIDLRAIERMAHDVDRLVVRFAIDRERRAVLAAVRERKARRVLIARPRAVDQLGGERERAQCLGA